MKRLLEFFVYENTGGIASAITVWIVVGLLLLASWLGIDRSTDVAVMLKFATIASLGALLGLPLLTRLFR